MIIFMFTKYTSYNNVHAQMLKFSFSCYFSKSHISTICTHLKYSCCSYLYTLVLFTVRINMLCMDTDTWGRCWHSCSAAEHNAKWLPETKCLQCCTCLQTEDRRRCQIIREKLHSTATSLSVDWSLRGTTASCFAFKQIEEDFSQLRRGSSLSPHFP